MEGEEIGMALARASELRSKIAGCIDRCAGDGRGVSNPLGGVINGRAEEKEEEEEEEEEEETESLISIRDALDSLEQQLSSLQALQHQQRYEREAALGQIDRSRKILLSKLKEYKGEDLEVIEEASNFASGSIEHDEDLLLPPYPSHLPVSDSYALDDLYPFSRLSSKLNNSSRNKLGEDVMINKTKKTDESEEEHHCCREIDNRRSSSKGVKRLVGLFAKSVLTIVSVASVLSLAGFKPTLEKTGVQLNILELLNNLGGKAREAQVQCRRLRPPKVVDDGKPTTSFVKERVEIPFELDVTTPNIHYGFG